MTCTPIATGRVYKNRPSNDKEIAFKRAFKELTRTYKDKANCRHRWRVGSHNGILKGKRIIKNSLNIWCEKCGKYIQAYYFPKGF